MLRDQVELAHLQELRAVVRLLLQRRDRALERVDRLGVVLVRRQVVRVLHLAHLASDDEHVFEEVYSTRDAPTFINSVGLRNNQLE